MKNKPKFKVFFAIMLVISILTQQFSLTAVLADGTEQEIILNDSEGESIDEGNIEQPAPLSVPDPADTLPPAVAPGDIEGPEDDQDMPVLPEDEDKNAISNPTDTEGDLNDTTDPTDTEGDQNDTTDPTDTEGDQNGITDPTDTEGDQNGIINPNDPDQEEEGIDKTIEEQQPRTLELQGISTNGSFEINFYVDGKLINNGGKLDYDSAGLSFKIEVKCNIQDGKDVLRSGDTVIYNFPSNLPLNNVTNGYIADKGVEQGTYEVENNVLKLHFNDKFINGSTRYVNASFEGILTAEQIGNGEGEKIEFSFPGIGTNFIIEIDRDPNKNYVDVVKSDGIKVESNSDEYIYSFILELTSSYDNTDITVKDELGENLELIPDTIKFFTNAACTERYEGTYERIREADKAFEYKIGKMTSNEKIFIKYNVKLLKEAYMYPYQEGRRKNTVKVITGGIEKSDTGKVNINKTWVEKSGKYENGEIVWTIYINQGDQLVDIGGTFIKDSLSNNQTYIEDTLKIQESDDGKNFGESSLEITWAQLQEGYKLPTGSNKVYKIEYRTRTHKSNEVGQTTFENIFEVYPWGESKKHESKANVTIGEEPAYKITKERLTPDDTSKTVEWKVTFDIPEGGIEDLQVDDKLPLGMDIVEGSLEVIDGKDLFSEDDFSFSLKKTEPNGESFRKVYTIRFGDVKQAGHITFKIKTEFVNGVVPEGSTVSEGNTFKNEVWLKSGPKKDLAIANAVYRWFKYLSKSSVTNGVPKGRLGWRLNVVKLPEATSSFVIEDEIPEKTSYIENSLEIYKNNVDISEKYKNNIAVFSEGQKILFTFTGELLELAKKHAISIQYQLKIDEYTDGIIKYKNKAQAVIDGVERGWISATQNYNKKEEITKTGSYNGNTAPYIIYTVKVNPDALDLDTEKDTLELTDTLVKDLSFVMGSLEIDGMKVAGEQYKYDFDKRELKMTVPDSKAMTITYKVKVNLQVGTEFSPENGTNTCSLSGVGYSGSESSYVMNGKVLKSNVSAGSEGIMLSIYKYGYTETHALKGAEFEVYSLELDGNNELESQKLEGRYTTEADGYSNIALLRDTPYKIAEAKAPEGYQIDTTPFYLVFDGNNGIDWKDVLTKCVGNSAEIIVVPDNSTSYTYAKKNLPHQGSLKITKDFQGNQMTEEQKNKIKFILNGPFGYTEEIAYENFESDGSYTFGNLPIGEYTVTEKNAEVDGYSVITTYKVDSKETNKVDVVRDGSSEINITNTYSKEFGSLTIVKEFTGDDLTEEQKANITFKITGPEDYSRDVKYSEFKNGRCTIDKLQPGKYTVTEENADVEGYVRTTVYKVGQDVTNTGNVIKGDELTVAVTNNYVAEKKTGSLTIVKHVKGINLTDEQKKNITFTVTGEGLDNPLSITYDQFENGSHTFDEIPVGEYTVTETNAEVKGYTLTTVWKVVESETNEVSVTKGENTEIDVTNTYSRDKGQLEIEKAFSGIDASELTKEQKQEISFTIEGPDYSKTVTYDEFTNSKYVLEGLETGEYTVTETHAVDIEGHELSVSYNVEGGKVTVEKDDTASVKVTNTYNKNLGSLTIVKHVDGINLTDEQKKNITFTVTGEGLDNPLSITYDRFKNGSHTFEEIPVGEYTVTESNAEVKGYTLTTVWKVGESETNEVSITKGENTEIDVTNTYSRDKGQLEIEKAFSGIDASELTKEQKQEISFTITGPDYSKTVTYDKFTNSKYVLEGLETGEYTVTETHAADVKDHKLSISYSVADGKVTVEKDRTASVRVTNTYSKETGKLIIAKKFAGASLTESQKKDIIFKVTGPNGYNDTISYGQFKEGVYVYPNLPVGDYVVTESNAEVPGYSVTTTYNTVGGKVSVNANDESTVTVTNTYSRYSISTSASILKVDGDKKPLAGAELAIKNGNGDVIEKWISTDKAHTIWGKLSIGGKYVLTELKAPQGYTLAKDIEFTMPSNGIIELTMVDEKEVTLGKISATKKVSVINGDAIEDYKVTEDTVYYMALFKDAAGEERYTEYDVKPVVVKKDTSLSEAVVWDDIPFGTYYVFETDAAGKAIPLNVKQDVTDDAENPYSYTCVVAEGTTNKVELGTQAGNIAGQVALENVYQTELPSHYSKEGVIKVNKKVLKDGSTFNTNTKFYAGIFTKNEDGSYEQFTVITLKNNGTVLVNVPLGGEYQDGSEPITYYVRETDKYGDPLDADVFAYEISGEGEVTLAGENTQATVTITNTAKENTSEVDILKVDENRKALAGAAFTLTYNEAGVTAGKWTSTTTARTLTLLPGSYTLTEVQAPIGYIKGSDATITVADDGTVKVSGDNVSYKDGVVQYVNKKSSTAVKTSGGSVTNTKYYAASNKGVTNTVYKASVKTGDETSIMLYLLLMIGTAAIAGSIICIRKRKTYK